MFSPLHSGPEYLKTWPKIDFMTSSNWEETCCPLFWHHH